VRYFEECARRVCPDKKLRVSIVFAPTKPPWTQSSFPIVHTISTDGNALDLPPRRRLAGSRRFVNRLSATED
jgi:hypothetical protein